ncbi:MAG: bifunctional diaminohydroxyphosphoribosylaminopyrimidine deaminase/5-amino-6-(5-phosphoribosylamino)uracil reductase RibD [Pseudomonadota bacterium]
MTEDEDARFMHMALALGRRAEGMAWPNPAVGCVIVKAGRVLGRGWTQPGGRPHAEPTALVQAGAAAQGATAYVSLEPCAHHGKTPPCSQALIDAKLARVVYAIADPDPRVAGQGAAMLRQASIEVRDDVLKEEAARAHRGFFQRLTTGRPRLTLKLASSFDGRIATATGESQWITGPLARRAVHAARARHDAILVGAGTARADNPMLSVRDMGPRRQPVRVVTSRRLDLPLDGHLATTANDIPLWLFHGKDASAAARQAWSERGARLFEVPLTGRQIDVAALLKTLGEAGLTSIFCEGGGALAASLLAADLVDDLIGFTAGIALGAEGQPSIGAMGLDRLAEAPRFKLLGTRRIGADIEHSWTRLSP